MPTIDSGRRWTLAAVITAALAVFTASAAAAPPQVGVLIGTS